MSGPNPNRVRDAEAEELLFCPGQTLAVWYSDDSMWHERLLLWPSMKPSEPAVWWVYTPDQDMYPEQLDLNPAEGPMRIRIKGKTFRYWSRFSEPTYRFRDVIDNDELKRLIRQAIDEVKAAGHWSEDQIPMWSVQIYGNGQLDAERMKWSYTKLGPR